MVASPLMQCVQNDVNLKLTVTITKKLRTGVK